MLLWDWVQRTLASLQASRLCVGGLLSWLLLTPMHVHALKVRSEASGDLWVSGTDLYRDYDVWSLRALSTAVWQSHDSSTWSIGLSGYGFDASMTNDTAGLRDMTLSGTGLGLDVARAGRMWTWSGHLGWDPRVGLSWTKAPWTLWSAWAAGPRWSWNSLSAAEERLSLDWSQGTLSWGGAWSQGAWKVAASAGIPLGFAATGGLQVQNTGWLVRDTLHWQGHTWNTQCVGGLSTNQMVLSLDGRDFATVPHIKTGDLACGLGVRGFWGQLRGGFAAARYEISSQTWADPWPLSPLGVLQTGRRRLEKGLAGFWSWHVDWQDSLRLGSWTAQWGTRAEFLPWLELSGNLRERRYTVFPLSQYVDGYFSAAPDWVGAVTPNVGLAWQNKSWAVGLKVAQFVPIAKTLHPSADSTDARSSVYGGLKAKIFIEFNK